MSSLEKLYLKNKKYYQRRLRIILDRLYIENEKILDLGCGEMLLKDFLPIERNGNYLGVDNIAYQNISDFICMDVLQFLKVNHNHYDFIFCLGLLDHLELEVQNEFLDLISLRQHSKIILSKSNEKNIFFRFLNVGRGVEFEHQFLILKKIYLLKIPKTSLVIHLTFIGSIFATEVIYFLASKRN